MSKVVEQMNNYKKDKEENPPIPPIRPVTIDGKEYYVIRCHDDVTEEDAKAMGMEPYYG